MLTAEELYRQFVRDSPALALRVSQRDLAAILGVTPVGLNRIVRRNASLVKRRDGAGTASAEDP
jgi:hypothetical protein